jgi:acetyl esterase/lipase
MGSCYFYLEFLLVWHHLLVEAGFQNPAVFALDYTLVPEGIYPKQVKETLEGYMHVLDAVNKDASKVCVAGDSAGGALVLSLLQELGAKASNQEHRGIKANVRGSLSGPAVPDFDLPWMATLISPWVTLMTNSHYPSSVDYLDRQTLWRFAHEYAGEAMINQHPASPGNCLDEALWKAASPGRGYYVIYGEEEVFHPDIEAFIKRQSQLGIETKSWKVPGGVHAWPVASLFLSSTADKRLEGLRRLVREIKTRFGDDMKN